MRRSRPLLGTFVTITAYGPDREALNVAVTAAFEEFQQVDALMSIHRASSELSQVNARAAQAPTPVSAALFEVLAKAREIATETDGAFDVTVRPLADLWGFIRKEYRLPTTAELQKVLPWVKHRLVELDAAQRTVQFRKTGVSLDLGGIAKGYAVDRAIDKLRAAGVVNALVKAGGDLRVIGAPPGRKTWQVQLEDPRKRDQRVTIPLRDGALSTSGNYENFFEAGGRRYSPILDPRTGLPVQGVAACTVVAPTCMESDAWATACFVMGVEKSLAGWSDRFAIRFTLMPADAQTQPLPIRATKDFPAIPPQQSNDSKRRLR